MTMTSVCAVCGNHDLREEKRDVVRPYKGHNITLKAVPGLYCAACGEAEFLTTGDAEKFAQEVQMAMQAIDVQRRTELRSIRRRLGLRQAEAATLFGGGINAFSEYERGVREPSKSTVLLLRLLDRHPDLLQEARAVAEQSASTESLASTF
jgi:HTH-type transcriptional regulator/antitoxin MqsA